MKKAIYVTEDDFMETMTDAITHFGDDMDDENPNPLMLIGFGLFGIKLKKKLFEKFGVMSPNEESIDFPNSDHQDSEDTSSN